MTKDSLRIIYMGTPNFAVAGLRALIEGGYKVVAVVTMPDKPIGRHQTELSQSAVKQYALSQGLPILQPVNLKDPTFLTELSLYKADVQVVVAFRMLPEAVWSMPPLGTFNLHASLLPQYRGAAPINWAIINGEQKTGVTTFFLNHQIDTGCVIRQSSINITEQDNAGSIHDRLMLLGAEVILHTINDIILNTAVGIPQSQMMNDIPLRHAPKIFKEDCRINWKLPCLRIFNFIRGLSPSPAAWTELVDSAGKTSLLKIYEASYELSLVSAPIGSVISDNKTYLKIAVSDGYLCLKTLQIAGKKRMDINDFLKGFRLNSHRVQ